MQHSMVEHFDLDVLENVQESLAGVSLKYTGGCIIIGILKNEREIQYLFMYPTYSEFHNYKKV